MSAMAVFNRLRRFERPRIMNFYRVYNEEKVSDGVQQHFYCYLINTLTFESSLRS
jgi:hypothetical protein